MTGKQGRGATFPFMSVGKMGLATPGRRVKKLNLIITRDPKASWQQIQRGQIIQNSNTGSKK